MSTIGKQVRLSQLFNQRTKNSIVVAMDHAAVLGPIQELLILGKPLN